MRSTKLGLIRNLIREPGDDTEAETAAALDTWPVLHPEALHGMAGDIVRAIEPHTEAAPVALLMQFIVAFGNLIGGKAHFVADGAEHFTNLFCVLVGDTSKGRKGTALNRIMPLLRAQDETWGTYQSGLSAARVSFGLCVMRSTKPNGSKRRVLSASTKK